MSFLKKLKNIVGKTEVKLDYQWIESPFPFNDPMIKATLRVKAENDPFVVLGKTGVFYAQRTVNGVEEEIILGTEEDDADNCATVERNEEWVDEFPDAVKPGEERSYGFFVGDMDLVESLQKWGVDSAESAQEKGIRFFFKGEVDIKGTLFDPSLVQEIVVK